jgi:hypothetical protein
MKYEKTLRIGNTGENRFVASLRNAPAKHRPGLCTISGTRQIARGAGFAA